MLGQHGEAGRRVLTRAEAQQREGHCNAAMHNNNSTYYLCGLFTFFVLFSQEEKEEEKEKAEFRETSSLPSTLGGGEGIAAQQADGGARCYLI